MLIIVVILISFAFAPWWFIIAAVAGFVAFFLRADADISTLIALYFYSKPANSKCYEGKTILVTGASSGIGEALCYELAKKGAKLVLCARREGELRRVRQACTNADRHIVLPLDLAATDTHNSIANDAIDKAGGRIDTVIQNAGRSSRGLAEDVLLEVDKDQLHLNVIGTISFTKALLPHFIQNKSGHIVVVSSIAGKLGSPGSANYSAAKAALLSYFDALRIETCVQGITVTNVAPGPVATDVFGNAMTATGGRAKEEGTPKMPHEARAMPTARFAGLMAAAMQYKIEETWISPNPELFYVYLKQYAPTAAIWIMKKAGPKRVEAFRKKKKQ